MSADPAKLQVRYLVCPGVVSSQSDGTLHYINAHTVARLYGVDPRQCQIATDDTSRHNALRTPGRWIELRPDPSGDYQIPDRTFPAEFDELFGKTLVSITGGVGDDEMVFVTDDGLVYKLHHDQECCESVSIEDVCGDLIDLLGTPILSAYEESNYEGPEPEEAESYTWTFYVLASALTRVTIRWLGQSTGYSEEVDFSVTIPGNRPRLLLAQASLHRFLKQTLV